MALYKSTLLLLLYYYLQVNINYHNFHFKGWSSAFSVSTIPCMLQVKASASSVHLGGECAWIRYIAVQELIVGHAEGEPLPCPGASVIVFIHCFVSSKLITSSKENAYIRKVIRGFIFQLKFLFSKYFLSVFPQVQFLLYIIEMLNLVQSGCVCERKFERHPTCVTMATMKKQTKKINSEFVECIC